MSEPMKDVVIQTTTKGYHVAMVLTFDWKILTDDIVLPGTVKAPEIASFASIYHGEFQTLT